MQGDGPWGSFKRCATCSCKIAPNNGHTLCLFCLGESHHPDSCGHCLNFSKRTRKDRANCLRIALLQESLQPTTMLTPPTLTALALTPTRVQRWGSAPVAVATSLAPSALQPLQQQSTSILPLKRLVQDVSVLVMPNSSSVPPAKVKDKVKQKTATKKKHKSQSNLAVQSVLPEKNLGLSGTGPTVISCVDLIPTGPRTETPS